MLTRLASDVDIQAIRALCEAYDEVEIGVSDLDIDDVREMLALPGSINRVTVDDTSGALLGFAHLHRDGSAETVVDPAGPDPAGLQRTLLTCVVDDARAQGLSSITHWSGPRADGAGVLLSAAGFAHVRSSWRMHIPAAATVGPPNWPTGVELRTFDRDRDAKTVWAFVQQHFAGTYGSVPRSFPDWSERFLDAKSGVACAVDASQLVAVAMLSARADHGFIATLVVDSAERGRGIGLALLTHIIGSNAEAGLATRLNVDGTNDRALALYRKAGMDVDAAFRQWEHSLT